MSTWDLIVGVAIGICATRLYLYTISLMAQPYRWSCPECLKTAKHFKLALNDETVLENIKADHLAKFHD